MPFLRALRDRALRRGWNDRARRIRRRERRRSPTPGCTTTRVKSSGGAGPDGTSGTCSRARSGPVERVERDSAPAGAGALSVREGSGLQAGLDLEGDGDLVADDGSAAFQRHLDADAEVLAVDDGGGLEAGDRALAHTGVDAVELEPQVDRAGDAVEREVARDDVVVTVGTHVGGGEGGDGELLGVEEVGGADVRVTVGVLGVDGLDVDLGVHGCGAVLGDGDGAGEVLEAATHLADDEVADGEAHVRVDGVDGPGAGGQAREGGGGGRHGASPQSDSTYNCLSTTMPPNGCVRNYYVM